MRIDAHQHYWRYDAVRDSWITPEMGAIRRDFLPAQVAPLLRAAGIAGVVAVQTDQSEQETDFLLALAADHPFIKGVVGWVDLLATDLEARLTRWQHERALKGFRHIAQGEPDDFLAREDIARGVAAVGRRGYAYDILIYPRQLAAAQALVARCPDVRFVLDHCAKPPIAGGDLSAWHDGLVRLAAHPNVICKLSGLVTEADHRSWTATELAPALDMALAAFGADRLMFGSDWPVCLLAAQYSTVHDVIMAWAGQLSEDEHAGIFGGTAVRAYRLEE